MKQLIISNDSLTKLNELLQSRQWVTSMLEVMSAEVDNNRIEFKLNSERVIRDYNHITCMFNIYKDPHNDNAKYIDVSQMKVKFNASVDGYTSARSAMLAGKLIEVITNDLVNFNYAEASNYELERMNYERE